MRLTVINKKSISDDLIEAINYLIKCLDFSENK